MYCIHGNNGYVNTQHNVTLYVHCLSCYIQSLTLQGSAVFILYRSSQSSVLATGTSTVTMQLLQFDRNFSSL